MELFSTWMNQFRPDFIKFGLTGIKIIAVLLIGWPLSTWISNKLSSFFKRVKMETTVRRSVKRLISVLMKALLLIFVLHMTGIKMTVLAAILGGLSISFGLALKGNIASVANGILLVINKPFRAGDYIEVGTTVGTVQHVDLLNTELLTPNNQKIVVPNSHLLNQTLTNYTTHPTRRIEINVGLAYDDDVEVACQVLKSRLSEVEGVLADPPLVVWLVGFGDSSINLTIHAWCKRTEFLQVRHQLIIAVQLICAEEGYTIPFPQQDVHIISGARDESLYLNPN